MTDSPLILELWLMSMFTSKTIKIVTICLKKENALTRLKVKYCKLTPVLFDVFIFGCLCFLL